MPFCYTTSLAKLHFPEDAVYEVSPTDTLHSRAGPWHISSHISMHFGEVRASTLTLWLWDEGTAAHWITLPAMPYQ